MKKFIYLSIFFLIGCLANIILGVYYKEFLIAFLGNEMLLGIIMFVFFASILTGIYFYKHFPKKLRDNFYVFLILIALFSVLMVLNIHVIRILRSIAKLSFYELFQMHSLLYNIFFVIFPTTLVLGILIPYSISLFNNFSKDKVLPKSICYLSLGIFAGGILFSFVLTNFFNHIEIILMPGAAAVLLLFILNTFGKKNYLYLFLNIIIIAGFAAGFYFSSDFEKYTQENRWDNTSKDMILLKQKDSSSENIAIGLKEDLYHIIENGVMKQYFPEPVTQSILAHLILIQHKKPENILVVGFPSKQFADEAFKHGVKTIDFTAFDKEIITLTKEYNKIDSGNVNIILKDPLDYMKNTKKKYDLVIYFPIDPDSLLTNRLFTLETFSIIKKILSPDGIFTSSVIGDYYYMFDESLLFNKAHFNTLKKSFKNCYTIPGDNIYYFCTQGENNITMDPDKAVERFAERKIESKFFDAEYYYEILKKEKIDEYNTKLNSSEIKIVNKNSNPISYLYSSYLYTKSYDINKKTTLIPEILQSRIFSVSTFSIILLLFILFFFFYKDRNNILIVSTAWSGFILFFLLIFSFQNILGYLYKDLGFLAGLFALGSSIGSYISGKSTGGSKKNSLAVLLLFMIIILFIFINLTFISFLKNIFIIYSIFGVMLILNGFITGYNFVYNTQLEENVSESALTTKLILFFAAAAFASFLWGTSIIAVLGTGLITLLVGLINLLLFVLIAKNKI